ncbi:MAG TPA: fused MFS/spermidine synthase [Candidatus Binatia bacterium]|jgi:spermidine synthase
MLAALFLCFFLSGAAALVYEVVWMRMLTQIFGSTAYAVATVLAAFMAGLALGSYVFGRLAERRTSLLRLYGALELGVGVYGFVAPSLFFAARGIYAPLFWLYELSPGAFNIVLFILAFLLLALPTFLMGATLPVLSQVFVRNKGHLGQRIGDLYATNTLGAVVGCALAGYYLIPQLGLSSTVYTAAIGNIVIAVIVMMLSLAPYGEAWEAADEKADVAPGRRTPTEWLLLAAIALSGAAAMIFENAWTHALTLVIGGSVYSFTTMLLTFLVGLAAGGYLYARVLGRQPVTITAFGVVELSVGITAITTIPMFEKLPLVFLRLHESFGDSFALFLAIQVLLAFVVMFIPALLLGMTFPLVVSLFTQNICRVGSSVGTTYASNTLGAIAGAFIGGFVLLPLVGIQHSIVIGALLNLAVACALLIGDARPGRPVRLAIGGAVSAALVIIGLRFTYWDPVVMTSGVTVYANRYAAIPTDSLRLEEMHRDRLLYYREGLTATISVHEMRFKTYRYFKTNGKVDGSYGDALTMLMTGYLPMLLRPDARDVAVIGLGTGMTVKAVGTFPVKKIDVLEIEPAMAEAAAYFGQKNGHILKDPRVRLIPSDGRNYLMAVPRQYDLIISEPSNPWIAGIASLFTRDFYATARQKLTPDGVFAQWLHNYSMSPDDFRMVLRTFAEAFPHVSVWNFQESDFLLIGSQKEQGFDYPRAQKFLSSNEILRDDFQSLGLSDAYSVLGFYRMGRPELLRLAEGAEYNTDDNARLEFSAPRSLGTNTSELNRKIMEPFVAPAPWAADAPVAPERRRYLIAEALHASGWEERALAEVQQALAVDQANADYHLLRAQILAAQDKTAEASRAAQIVITLDGSKVKKVMALAKDLYTGEASQVYLKAIEANPKEIIPYLGLGTVELQRNRIDDAEAWLRRAEALQPKHAAVLLALGRLEVVRKNYPRAVVLLEAARAAPEGEESSILYGTLGNAYVQLGRWDEAVKTLEQALLRQRKNSEWRLLQARALTRLGRPREAELRYREVLAMEPSNGEAWEGLKSLGRRY